MTLLQRYGISLEHDAVASGKPGYREHSHSVYEVYFLISGKRRYLMGDAIYDVEPGDLVIVPKEQLHRTTSESSEGYHRYVVYFDRRQICLLAALVGEEALQALLRGGCLQLPAQASRELQCLFEALARELTTPGEYAFGIATHLLQGILLTALRHGKSKDTASDALADRIQTVVHYITEHYPQPITLEDAAHMACMEKTYFSRRFRKLTGFGFLEYLTQRRLLEAKRLLRETRLSIGQISEACGFSGGNYFGDVFHSSFGLSPTAYRKQQQNTDI